MRADDFVTICFAFKVATFMHEERNREAFAHKGVTFTREEDGGGVDGREGGEAKRALCGCGWGTAASTRLRMYET